MQDRVRLLGKLKVETEGECGIPFVDMSAPCGFPSPASDYAQEELDLNEFFVTHPAATFVVRAGGDSMRDAGIEPGDLLIVDRAKEPRNGDIVLAFYDGGFTVKRYFLMPDGGLELRPENADADYPILRPSWEEGCLIEGVITGLGRKFG